MEETDCKWRIFFVFSFSIQNEKVFFYLCISLEICLPLRFMSIVLWPGMFTLCKCDLKMHVVGEGPDTTLSFEIIFNRHITLS